MKILITGAKGFVGRNLAAELRNRGFSDLMEYDVDTGAELLDSFCRDAEFVFHLAGVNRPESEEDFMKGNWGFTSTLLDTLAKYGNPSPVMLSSSTQAALDNPYGRSKKAGEDLLFRYAADHGVKVLVYRFPNVFGKWCRPNYNSAVATFCHNVARGLPVTVNNPDTVLNLVYIDDVVEELVRALDGRERRAGEFCEVGVTHTVRLGAITELLYSFRRSREDLSVPDMADAFTKKLYSTYLSYLPEDGFSYPLDTKADVRGSFTEIIRTPDRGQVSVNVSKPGITKGNHWHHTKTEKFLVVSGTGVIRFRRVGADEVLEYFVDGGRQTVVDIPPGFTHNIENLGETDLVTVMWASERFDPDRPDTFFLEV
ncbi:MAG: capsular polysaccharide biosynthesis protein CapF [Saccharofermentanales bacterium]